MLEVVIRAVEMEDGKVADMVAKIFLENIYWTNSQAQVS